jgi:porphobilinogen synthase
MVEFPRARLRRLRRSGAMRRLVRETRVQTDDLVYPLFVEEGRGVRREIDAMPGICRLSPDKLAGEVREIAGLGIPGVLLFGIPPAKD